MPSSIEKLTSKAAHSEVVRRVLIKRKVQATGLFETNWQNVTDDVKKFGTLRISTDFERLNKFTISNMKVTMANDTGRYSPETNINSLWYSFGAQQRSLVQIEAGFLEHTSTAGVFTNYEVPRDNDLWDVGLWDEAVFERIPIKFKGILSGDMPQSDQNEVVLNVRPLTQLFKDYPAQLLTAYDDSMTAQKFMEMVRDHTDSKGDYIFRPFFDDTTSSWEIDATTKIYSSLNTSGAQDVIDKTVWDVMQKLAESENFYVYVTREGMFRFTSKSGSTAVKYKFLGNGGQDDDYGHTVKSLKSYGQNISGYYSRVQVKYKEEDTSTSYTVKETILEVNSFNTPWQFGNRTYKIENTWLSVTTAETIADEVFQSVGNIKNEIEFTTSFVPQLDVLDHINLTYNTLPPIESQSLWDQNNWAPGSDELIWDKADGAGIDIDDEFKILSIGINFDKLECTFKAREA